MDTLTNVVGVLLIMLAIAQLSVGATVRKIKNFVEPVENSEITNANNTKAELQKEVLATEDEWKLFKDKTPLINIELKNIRTDSASLKREISRLEKRHSRIKSLQEDINKYKEEIALLTTNKNKLHSQIDELEKTLSEIPKPEENPEPILLPLPSPISPPDNTNQFDFYCYKGKIHFIRADINDIRNNLLKIMRSKLNYVALDQPINCTEAVEYFKKEVVYNRNYQVRMGILDGELEAVLSIQPKLNIGESLDQIKYSNSRYQTRLARLDPSEDYIRFYVDPESFELYIEARELARKMSINGGWSPINSKGEVYFKLNSKNPLACINQKKEVMPKAPARIKIRAGNQNFKGVNITSEVQYSDIID